MDESAAQAQASPRRRGRPRRDEAEDTRQKIVAAATAEFDERGYDATSLRGVARRAGVDPALVHHYFDDKSALFSEVVSVPLRPDRIVQHALGAPLDRLGETIVREVLTAWENPLVRPAAATVLRTAIGPSAAGRFVREFVRREILLRVATRLDAPDAELRATLAGAQLAGLLMMRYVAGLEPVASTPVEELVTRVGPAVQWHLTGFGADTAPMSRPSDASLDIEDTTGE